MCPCHCSATLTAAPPHSAQSEPRPHATHRLSGTRDRHLGPSRGRAPHSPWLCASGPVTRRSTHASSAIALHCMHLASMRMRMWSVVSLVSAAAQHGSRDSQLTHAVHKIGKSVGCTIERPQQPAPGVSRETTVYYCCAWQQHGHASNMRNIKL